MKRVDLYVDGRHLIIEEIEGRAEIRDASQPRCMSASWMMCALRFGPYDDAHTRAVELRVEKGE